IQPSCAAVDVAIALPSQVIQMGSSVWVGGRAVSRLLVVGARCGVGREAVPRDGREPASGRHYRGMGTVTDR
ncbi:hypothetical protein DBR34_01925, partial [Stenotrophomonas sp. HMWF003]